MKSLTSAVRSALFRLVAAGLCFLMSAPALNAQAPTPESSQTQDPSQLRESLLKFGQDETKLLLTPKNGDPVEGKVVSVTATTFRFRETKSGDVKEIAFDSVGSISVVPNSHRRLIVGVLLGVAAGVVLFYSYLGCKVLSCG